MVKYEYTNCFLGKAVTLSDGKTELTVTLDVGPRIISLRTYLEKQGRMSNNIMYEDVPDVVNKDCSSYYGEGKVWHIYGGHRLWLSPEDITTYYPDSYPVEFQPIDNGGIFTPRKWDKVEVQPSIKVEFLDEGIKVTHSMTNLGEARKLCLWALTVMKAGGVMILPLSTEDTGLLANRNIVMWSYASLNDFRFYLGDDKAILTSVEVEPSPFKFGAYKRDLYATYELDDGDGTVLFSKKVQGVDGAEYPDYTCNFESYCTNVIHEIETLSPIRFVETGKTIEHVEIWNLKEN